ncbi:MAG: hypothetical protein LBD59_04505, partial [Prevotellaceae bacterium]|nr:hypothetical protein [Prevotellaceae bacterium]
KFTFSKTTTITSLSGENYEVEPGDYYIGDETEMKGEKIVAGKIYDKDGKVKHSIFHKRNH